MIGDLSGFVGFADHVVAASESMAFLKVVKTDGSRQVLRSLKENKHLAAATPGKELLAG